MTSPVALHLPGKVAVLSSASPGSAAWIATAQPRLAFVKALAWLDHEAGFARPDGEPEIHPSVGMGSGVSIGRGVTIGEGSVLGHNIRIADGVRIGKNCRIKSGSVIGEDGFGFEPDTDGTPLRMIHLGGVVIGDRVEIGSLNTVCQGTLGPTIVEDDVKTDDHVHIAHNCQIKRRTIITAGVVVAGGVTVGEAAWIACNATILNGLTIGDRAFIGLGAVVIRDIPPRTTVVGNPGRPLDRGA
jgi:UDP-3-O-[3-hydroxymyristoyl] glucosamine N-acyltransferase